MIKKENVEASEKRTTFSLSLSVEDKKAIKKYAVDHETTVAAVVHEWIQKNCKRVEEAK
jgi:hypothetical protein